MDKEKRLTPIKAIRAKCLECSGDNNAEVRKSPLSVRSSTSGSDYDGGEDDA